MKTIHNNLRAYRLHKGLRQQDISHALGHKTAERMTKWEQGTALPSVENLFKLCNILNVFPHQLYPSLLTTKQFTITVSTSESTEISEPAN